MYNMIYENISTCVKEYNTLNTISSLFLYQSLSNSPTTFSNTYSLSFICRMASLNVHFHLFLTLCTFSYWANKKSLASVSDLSS